MTSTRTDATNLGDCYTYKMGMHTEHCTKLLKWHAIDESCTSAIVRALTGELCSPGDKALVGFHSQCQLSVLLSHILQPHRKCWLWEELWSRAKQ